MTSSNATNAYDEGAVTIGGIYQRFQYGFGGYLEVLVTLLEKQHWQAAADVMPLLQRERIAFEGALLAAQTELTQKSINAGNETASEDAPRVDGPDYGQAANTGEPPA